MAFSDRLQVTYNDLKGLFTDLHAAKDESQQLNPHLREASSAISSALTAVERAHKHAVAIEQTESRAR